VDTLTGLSVKLSTWTKGFDWEIRLLVVATIPVMVLAKSMFFSMKRESHEVENVALTGTGALVPAGMMTVSEA